MIAYKLVRKRKDGSLGSLFINRRQKLRKNVQLVAEDHPTKGYKHRPGWHCTLKPEAPHLSQKGRVWVKVWIEDYTIEERPESQGGKWALAKKMMILKELWKDQEH